MIRKVRNVRHFKIIQNYHHTDLMYAKNARKLVYKDILKFIQEINTP